MIDSIFDASYDWDIQTGVVEFSPQLSVLLGIEGDPMNSFEAWIERLHPDDRERATRAVEAAARDSQRFAAEYRLRREDGSYVPVRDRGLTINNASGQPAHMVGVMRDVTEERETERLLTESAELYQTLFDKARNPAFMVDRSGRYLDANSAGLMFVETDRRGLLSMTMADHWCESAVEAVQDIEAGPATLETEVCINGLSKVVIANIVPCHLGGDLRCFVLATDITEHRTLATALEDSNVALRVFLDQRARDRDEFEKTIVSNLEEMVLPLLARIAPHVARSPVGVFLDTAIVNLRQIMQPLSQSMHADEVELLTLREREIATLIRAGKTSSEIAAALFISAGTVAFHRKNIRRKLGLQAHGPRLASHLTRAPSRSTEAAAS